jgi:hypothetical protein
MLIIAERAERTSGNAIATDDVMKQKLYADLILVKSFARVFHNLAPMLANFATLHANTMTDAAVTTHLLQDASSPTTLQLLCGLAQLRQRGLDPAVARFHQRALFWMHNHSIDLPEPLNLALELPAVIGTPISKRGQNLLMPRTGRRIASALVDHPVGSILTLARAAGLDERTVRRALSRLKITDDVKLVHSRGVLHYVSTPYLAFFEALLPFPLHNHRPSWVTRISASTWSPFDSVYDPMGFHLNPPHK